MPLFEHQTAAVPLILRALARHGGALLCDPPGTGKSLIACEAAVQCGAQRVSVIAPLHLLAEWRRLLDDHDLSAATVVSHDAALPSLHSDLVIIDEAHRLRNPATRRYRSIAAACVGARVLLITATPIVAALADLMSLLRLFIADDHFSEGGLPSLSHAADGGDPRRVIEATTEVLIRRSALPQQLCIPRAVERTLHYRTSLEADEVHSAILSMVFPGAEGSASSLRQLMWRRYLSSPAALRGSLTRQLQYLRKLEERRSAGWDLQRSARGVGRDPGGEQAPLFPQAFGAAAPQRGALEVAGEIARCEALIGLLAAAEGDPKLELLLQYLAGKGAGLIFTESAETAEYIWSAIPERSALVTSRKSRVGEMSCSASRALEAFRSGAADRLISTDMASEGLNLERASFVVHYDLAWVPVRLEQRVGRAARLGSTRDRIESVLILPDRKGDLRTERLTARRKLSAALDLPPRSRSRAPSIAIPYLPSTEPHARIAKLLRERGERDRELVAMLGNRYVAGIELALEELAARGQIPTRLVRRTLLRLLEVQRATSKIDEPSSNRCEVQRRKPPLLPV